MAPCLIAAACAGEDPVVPGPSSGPVTAYIDGELFIADTAIVTKAGQDIAVEARASNGRVIGFEFTERGPANYWIGPGNPVSGFVRIGASSWTAEGPDGGGTITLTAIFPTRIEGSFNMIVVGGASPASLEVSSGLFAIDFY